MKGRRSRSVPRSDAKRTDRFFVLLAVGTEGQTAVIFIDSKPINYSHLYFDEERRNWN
jgi:hypothetical protein